MEMINQDYSEIQKYFNENKYVVIKNFLTPDIAHLFYTYCLNRAIRADFMETKAKEDYRPEWDGHFGDPQINTNSFVQYGDSLMDTLLITSAPKIQSYTGLSLVPNYTYWRLYQYGDELKRHSDRDSCEISITMCLGYNVANVDQSVYPEYNWPMFVESSEYEDGAPVHMTPGDMIIYRGCDIEHWREKFIGLNHAQVFMHYNDKNGPFNNYLDGRPIVGIPKKFQAVS
jgi:hypothetical protein